MASDRQKIDVFLHEIRNPLSTLLTLIRLFQKRLSEEDENYALTLSMTTECQRMEWMLKNLENSELLESTISPYDLDVFIRQTVAVCRSIVESHDLIFCSEISDPTQGYQLSIHPDIVRQIIDNLMNNACKYNTPGGKVTLTIIIIKTSPVPQLHLAIKDTGRGINPTDIPNIFLPYSRYAPDQPGKGLGLAIVKTLLDQINGTIEIKSHLYEGSEFIVTIPLAVNT